MIFEVLAQKILSQIDLANNILLVGHKKPDGDGLGALCALSRFLKQENKKYRVFCVDKVPRQYLFLPFIEEVENDLEQAKEFNPDLIIVLDTGDLRHAGLADYISDLSQPFIINIDHHPSNENYGQINLVDVEAVATSEIIYRFFKEVKFNISKDVATCLLTGIIFDTNNFTNPNTTFPSLQATSDLLKSGARLPQINDNTIRNKNLPTLQLWGEVLMRLKYNPEFNIATTIITQKDLEKYQVDPDVVDGLSNFLNNLSGVNAAIILKEEDEGIIKGSMRTNSDFIDLSKLAKILGGGGHRKAAGFTVKGKLKETKDGWQIV